MVAQGAGRITTGGPRGRSGLATVGAACAVILLAPTLASGQAAATPGESFRDGFDSFDRARWYVSDGWRNGPHQNCEWNARAVSLRDGHLVLSWLPSQTEAGQTEAGQTEAGQTEAGQTEAGQTEAGQTEAGAAHCGEVQTRAVFGYGTYEARIRTGAASGLNAAFFTYIGPVHGFAHDEIDVEILTRDTARLSVNAFVGGIDMPGLRVPLPQRSNDGFSTYAFVWEPARLRWYQNGALLHELTGAAVPATPQKIYLSHWGTDTLTDWMGPFAPPDGPLEMEIDWLAYTAPGSHCAFEGSLTCVLP
ncbi:MAG: family 16 glycosylhydrolase [Rhodobacterales bacterium]|nr:family 16 glycosylhydrolase [Rhodobacterales bacterium]